MSKRYLDKDLPRYRQNSSSDDDENNEFIDWETHRKTLDKLFFREEDFIQRLVIFLFLNFCQLYDPEGIGRFHSCRFRKEVRVCVLVCMNNI